MKSTRAILLAAALTVAPAAIPQDTVIRVNVRLVRLLVTVKDAAGGLVGSLDKRNFSLFDNGVKQDIAVFERHTDQPLSIAMLVDTSASTGKELKYELDSVNRFLRAVLREGNPDDAVAMYTFNWDVRIVSSFKRRIERLEHGLRQLKPEGGTSMYDAIYLASRDLEGREGRHVIVIITDGGDTTSYKDFHQALQTAQFADTVLYQVRVMPITNQAGRNIGGENALATLANGTGGAVFTPDLGTELDNAFDEILRQLRTQYLIGFYPKDVPPAKNRFHELRVKIDRPGLRVITRSGYYGESVEATR